MRWTEQRNFEAILGLMKSGSLKVDALISHRFDIDAAANAYDLLANHAPLGILLQFPQVDSASPVKPQDRVLSLSNAKQSAASAGTVGMIGSGNYAAQVLIPAFKSAGAGLGLLASAGGVSSVHNGKKFGFASATTDASAVATHADIDTVVIATRHDTHAKYAVPALHAGKHVFVEKPLCLKILLM